MIDRSYIIFENQLEDTIRMYPNLKIKNKNGQRFLKGILNVNNNDGELIHSYLIEIHWQKGFPFRFPVLYEIGGDIPVEVDWHKYNDNSCCITVEPQEILECKDGITIVKFIREYAIPYLANQSYKKIEGKYKDEYEHGAKGLISFYTELMQTTETKKWIKYIEYAFDIKKLNYQRNTSCFCGSGKKFKKCHALVFDKIRNIGKKNIISHLQQLNL